MSSCAYSSVVVGNTGPGDNRRLCLLGEKAWLRSARMWAGRTSIGERLKGDLWLQASEPWLLCREDDRGMSNFILPGLEGMLKQSGEELNGRVFCLVSAMLGELELYRLIGGVILAWRIWLEGLDCLLVDTVNSMSGEDEAIPWLRLWDGVMMRTRCGDNSMLYRRVDTELLEPLEASSSGNTMGVEDRLTIPQDHSLSAGEGARFCSRDWTMVFEVFSVDFWDAAELRRTLSFLFGDTPSRKRFFDFSMDILREASSVTLGRLLESRLMSALVRDVAFSGMGFIVIPRRVRSPA